MARSPNPMDKHIGARIRMRRLMLDMTQEKLASGLELTFQQVQKYEKGVNRVCGSRMQQIANILKVQPAFFFEDAPRGLASKTGDVASSPIYVTEFLATNDGIALVTAYMAISNPGLRRALLHVAQQIAAAQPKR